jgi:Integrase
MAKKYRLPDSGGLGLLVRPTGTKVWQYRYEYRGKPNDYTIGEYPRISLAEAREVRKAVKELVAKGIDPNQQKADSYAQNINANGDVTDDIDAIESRFETIARSWHSKQVWDAKHTVVVMRSLEKNVFPMIGNKAINKITPRDVLDVLQKMEDRNALDSARRVAKRIEEVFEHALKNLLVDYNPATGRGKGLKTWKRKHRPHLLPKYIPEFLNALESYPGSVKVKLAMKLLWLTFVRPGELRKARWEDFDIKKATWRIPAELMKMDKPHIVPLSAQALAVLEELRPITGKGTLLFPGERDANKPMSDVALLKALTILGFHKNAAKKQNISKAAAEIILQRSFVPHGVRGSASTILNEIGKFKADYIERQLAHIDGNSVRAAYNHAEYLDERIQMMQWWADYLENTNSQAL